MCAMISTEVSTRAATHRLAEAYISAPYTHTLEFVPSIIRVSVEELAADSDLGGSSHSDDGA